MKSMNNEKELPKRKDIRLKNYDYSSSSGYFLTICTLERRNYFWDNVGATIGRPQDVILSHYGNIVDEAINNISSIYPAIKVDCYVIMPDHIHLILRIESNVNGRILSAPTISTVIGSMKRWISKQIGKPIWQKSFYEHGIRNQQDYDEIWTYIDNNPLKYALNRAP